MPRTKHLKVCYNFQESAFIVIAKLHYISVLKTVPVRLVRDLTGVASMARTIDGRLLPTFLAASPIEEKEPTWEVLPTYFY